MSDLEIRAVSDYIAGLRWSRIGSGIPDDDGRPASISAGILFEAGPFRDAAVRLE